MSNQNSKLLLTGASVAMIAGMFTRSTPTPPAAAIDAHKVPGGSGVSGSVTSARGRAMKNKKRPGPNKRPKYCMKDCPPPVDTSSMADSRFSRDAEGPSEWVTRMLGSITNTASATPVGRLFAKTPSSSKRIGHDALRRCLRDAASDILASIPVTT